MKKAKDRAKSLALENGYALVREAVLLPELHQLSSNPWDPGLHELWTKTLARPEGQRAHTQQSPGCAPYARQDLTQNKS